MATLFKKFASPNINSLRTRYSRTSPTDYCINLVKTHDHENFLCTLLLPSVARSAAFAIRAFNIEIARVADQTNESNIAAMRIQFWKETLDSIYKKKAPEHPVAQELARMVERHQFPKRHLSRLVNARSNILEKFSFESIDLMEKYAEESVSPIYYLILKALDIESINADHAASHLGKAQGLANLLRSLPHNIERRQLLLPQDILLKHSLTQEDVLRKRNTDAIKQVVFEIASLANLHVNKARSLADSVPKEASSIFLPATPVAQFLENLENFDFDIFIPFLYLKNFQLGYKLFWRKLISKY